MLKLNVFFKLIFLFLTIFQISLISHRNGFEARLLFNFYKPSYGLMESLKQKKIYFVYEIYLLISKNNILLYNVDKKLIIENTAKIQRLVEVTYPARLDNKAKFFFTNDKNFNSKNCKPLDNTENIYLYECI
jgi:hypothetical protein